jgi:hypothetical protein
MKEWIQQYIKGCGTCQQNKTNMHPPKPLLYPITPEPGSTLFSTIAMDWITKLPPSFGYDSILTITDHDCSKAVLLFPCKETMGTTKLAKLYFNKVFPHYGIPTKIISDQDPRLTSNVTAGTGGTLELHLVPLVRVRQSQGPLLCASAGL